MKPPANNPAAPSQLVQIEKPIYGGSFLARDEGKAIFVSFALPGEEVRIRIVEDKSKRGFAKASVEEVVSSAPERTVPSCAYFGSCGGCNYQHADYVSQLRYKQAILRETFERSGVTPPEQIDVLAAEPWGYRNRIRLAFDAQGRPGYRAHASHSIVPIEACPIAAPLLVKAALAIANILRSVQPRPRISEIVLFTNSNETELLVSILIQAPARMKLEPFAIKLREEIPALTGAELVVEGRGPNPSVIAKWGAQSLTYQAAGFNYRVDHGAFFQVNRFLLDKLVDRVVTNQSGSLAWDLFAGVGLFSRQLASRFDGVVAVEIAHFATKALEANLAGTSSEAIRATTLDFLHGKHARQRPDLVVVDPPRAGLGAEVTAELAKVAAPSLVYVSCDPTTLARDLRTLLASGYTFESVALADLFPQTFHLESIVHLRHR
jgi:23S rRNA (uracil1939-C5)-methyltransferase